MKDIRFGYFSDIYDQKPKNYRTRKRLLCNKNKTTWQTFSRIWSPEFDDIVVGYGLTLQLDYCKDVILFGFFVQNLQVMTQQLDNNLIATQ